MKNISKIATLLFLVILSIASHAAYIDTKSYINHPNSDFWTNNDLKLDILRLSWVDTLGDTPTEPDDNLSLADTLAAVQKNLLDMLNFVNTNSEGWRLATIEEFDAYNQWFDSDTQNTGWSTEQKEGSSLFFELNGLGPAYSGPNEQNGYAGGSTNWGDRGYTYWQFGTLNQNNKFESVWFAMFADAFPEGEDDAECAIFNGNIIGENCGKGFLNVDADFPKFTVEDPLALIYDDSTDENGEYIYPQELHFFPVNASMLIVRDVNEAPVILSFIAGILFIFRRLKHN